MGFCGALIKKEDSDYILLGDFNTMGCKTNPEITSQEEIELLFLEVLD